MDEPLYCPDCHELHREPAGAALGHVVRCLGCDLETGLTADERQAEILTVRLELRPAA